MHLNRFSLDAPLPAGGQLGPVSRMRDTIHSYSMALCKCRWMRNFKPANLQTLQKRWHSAQKLVVGKSNVDLEIAYQQLAHKLECIASVLKGLQRWADLQADLELVKIPKALGTIRKYIATTGNDLAPDMNIVAIMADFWSVASETRSVSQAMEAIDYHKMVKWQEEFSSFVAENPVPMAPEALDNASGPAGDDNSKSGAAKYQRRVNRVVIQGEMLERRLSAPALHQVIKLVADGIVHLMYGLPRDIGEPTKADELHAFCAELDCIQQRWKALANIEGDDILFKVIKAARDLYLCLDCVEARRPSVEEARSAWKFVWDEAREDHPASEVAKALHTYESGKAAVSAAVEHSKAGIQDTAAATHMFAAIDRFEDLIEQSLTNPVEWALHGNSGGAQTVASIEAMLGAAKSTTSAVFGAIARFSPAALADHKDALLSTVNNLTLAMQLANFVLVMSVYQCMRDGLDGVPEATPAPDELTPDASLSDQAAALATAASEPGPMRGSAPEVATPTVADIVSMALTKFQEQGHAFSNNLVQILGSIHKCIHSMSQRLNIEPDADDDDFDTKVQALQECVENNSAAMTMVCEYFDSYAGMAAERAKGDSHMDAMISVGTEVNNKLVGFSKIHHEYMLGRACSFRLVGGLFCDEYPMKLRHAFHKFLTIEGQAMCDGCVMGLVSYAAKAIFDSRVNFNIVHDRIVKECDINEAFALLISSPHVVVLSRAFAPGVGNMSGVSSDGDFMAKFPHNVALMHIRSFADDVCLESVCLPDVVLPPGVEALGMEMALLILRFVCEARDISMIAAFLQETLIAPASTRTSISVDAICGQATYALRLLQCKLADADAAVNSPEALEIEKLAVRVSFSVANLRGWVKLMGIFAGRILDNLLYQMAGLLRSSAEACKSATPSWSACFEGGKLLEAMETIILTNKLPALVKAHNDVHGLVEKVSRAARILEVAPRIQEHEITVEEVRLALDALRHAGTASVIITGFELLAKFSHDPSGATKAKNCLNTYRVPAHEAVPASFWREFEHLATLEPTAGPVHTSTVAQCLCHDSRTISPRGKSSSSCRLMDSTPKTKAGSNESASSVAPPVPPAAPTPSPAKRNETTPPVAFKRARRS